MKSRDPLDPTRLEVTDVTVSTLGDSGSTHLRIVLVMEYEMWWGGPGYNPLWEQANALKCVDDALRKGGVGAE